MDYGSIILDVSSDVKCKNIAIFSSYDEKVLSLC